MRIRPLILLSTLSMCTWSSCQAGGTYRNGPMFVFPNEVKTERATMRSVSPLASTPDTTVRDLLGGCGRGRFRDQQTHRCLGPADTR